MKEDKCRRLFTIASPVEDALREARGLQGKIHNHQQMNGENDEKNIKYQY